MKMASVGTKRPHVLTKRMQEYLCTKRIASDGEGGTARLFRCPRAGCNKVLTSTPGLRYHIKTHDAQIGAYVCTRCHKRFRSYNGLRYHRQQTICQVQVSVEDYGYHALQAGHFYHHPIIKDRGNYPDYYGAGSNFSPPRDEEAGKSRAEGGGRKRCYSDSVTDYMSSASDVTVDDEQHNWLRELAIIATGPRSPLMQGMSAESSSMVALRDTMHSYAHPPRSRSASPPATLPPPPSASPVKLGVKIESPPHESSGYYDSEYSSGGIITEWHCFMKGSRMKFLSGQDTEWHLVEDVSTRLSYEEHSYGEEGLYVTNFQKCCCNEGTAAEEVDVEYQGEGHSKVTFSSSQTSESDILVECPHHHPFFVKDKGWCSIDPEGCRSKHAVHCASLSVGDLCLAPSHPLTSLTKDALDSLKSYDFTAMDSSAVLTLSNMAKVKKEQSMSPPHYTHPALSPLRIKPAPKAKRPMNAFMIFAKRFRLQYMQQHPGKDNRAISVLLGDRWKKLGSEERRQYLQEAKQLADEQKRRHPDCWKRKRTMSTGSIDN